MSVESELTAIRECIAQLDRAVSSLRAQCGTTLGLRRLALDVRRLEEDLVEVGPLSASAPSRTSPPSGPQPVEEHVYESDGADFEDEGLGGLPRR